MNRFIEAHVNELLIIKFEDLAISRGVTIDKQFDHMFSLFLGFYALPAKKRIAILSSIAELEAHDH